MVEMFVSKIGMNSADGHSVVLLKERDGTRVMPIWVGGFELRAIALALSETIPSRPQTHDLMVDALCALGHRVDHLEITEISDSAFLGKLFLSAEKTDEVVLDCRPSDGIALALKFGSPILVNDSVLDTVGYTENPPESKEEAVDNEFKNFISNIKASDFAKYIPGASEMDTEDAKEPPTSREDKEKG